MARILLIDDDEDMMRISANWLKKTGYETAVASSGEAALDALKEETPDLILLDYAMPGLDGPEIYKRIRSDERTKGIPVLFRTGMEDGTIDGIMEELKPQGVVPKSEGKKALLGAVSEILGA